MEALERLDRYQRALMPEFERLRRLAEYLHIAGLVDEPGELLNQAASDLFKKGCPDHVDPVAYVVKRMKNLAHNQRRDRLRRRSILRHADERLHPKAEPNPLDAALLEDRKKEEKKVAVEVLQFLQNRAEERNDDELVLLLMAMEEQYQEDGSYKRSALLEVTGMEARTYKVARERLSRLLKGVPDGLQSRVRSLISKEQA